MTTTLFAGINAPEKGKAVAVAKGDYSAADPAVVNVHCGGSVAMRIAVNVNLLSGSGCTATITVSGINDDVSATLYTIVSQAITATGVHEIIVDPRVPFSNSTQNPLITQEPLPDLVQIAVVGSGTRTTLTYSVEVECSD